MRSMRKVLVDPQRVIAYSLPLLMLLATLLASVNVSAPGGWSTEVVVSTGDVGRHASLSFDSKNMPHVSFSDRTMPGLRYASWTGSSWLIEVVDSLTTTEATSLAIDSEDRPHVAYRDYVNNDTKYAHWTGSSWEIEVADSENQSGLRVSLAMDSNDSPHLAYYSSCDDGRPPLLRYANKTGVSWQVATLHSVEYCDGSSYTSIALDSRDRPHIAYDAKPSHNLWYANWSGTSWNLEVVDTYPGSGDFASIAIDSNDLPHISYYSDTENGLKYAFYSHSPLGGWEWMIESVDSGNVGMSTSLALDDQDRPHISYTSDTSGPPTTHNLYYAHFADGYWSLETVDTDWVVGETSIALDRCGMPHIAYQAAPSGIDDSDLRHAWKPCINPLPDLVIQSRDISFLPSNRVGEGTNVTINATVHNDGIVNASDVLVRIYEGDPFTGTQIDGDKNVSLIPWGGSANVEVSWNASSVGTYDICVVVDPKHTIDELSELNNEACSVIEVLTTEAPGPPETLRATLTGNEYQHVTIEWSLSPDDLGGLRNVVRYDILRGESYGPDLTGYALLDSVSSGTSTYVDGYAGEGDPNNYFYVACAVNPLGNRSCAGNQAGKFTRPLGKGPQLVSIPLIQSNEDVDTVLQTVEFDKVWTYDSFHGDWEWSMSFKRYRRDLWSVNHTIGLWVNTTNECNLTVAGLVPSTTLVHLVAGWNFVGFPSYNSSFTVSDLKAEVGSNRVERFDSSMIPYHLKVMENWEILYAGYGYWVKVGTDTVWMVNVQ